MGRSKSKVRQDKRTCCRKNYPNKPSDNPKEKFPRIGKTELIAKERIWAKPKKMRKHYKKSLDSGRKSGRGRVVFTFCDLCESGGRGGGSPAVESVDTGIDSSSASVQDESADSVTDKCPNKMMKNLILKLL